MTTSESAPTAASEAGPPPRAAPRRPARAAFDGPALAVTAFVAAAGAMTLAAVVVSAAAALIEALLRGTRDQKSLVAAASEPSTILVALIVSQVAGLLVAIGATWLTRAPPRDRLGLRPSGLGTLRSAIVVGGGVLPLMVGLALAAVVASVMPSFGGADAVPEIWSSAPIVFSIVWCAVIGLLPGFVEELLFRGVIQRAFLMRLSPPLAIGTTSVMFGLLHLTPPAVVFATVLGIWLGVVAWRTNSVVLPMITHAFVNAGFNIVMMLLHRYEVDEATAAPLFWGVVAGAVACFAAAVVILVRRGPGSGRRAAVLGHG